MSIDPGALQGGEGRGGEGRGGEGPRTPAPAGSLSRIISCPQDHAISAVPWLSEDSAGAAAQASPGAAGGVYPNEANSAKSPQIEQLQAQLRGLEQKLEQFQTQQPQALREAQQRGRMEAEHAAQARIDQEIQPWLARMARTIEDLGTTKRRFLEDSEEQVVRLAIAIARRVLYREIQVDPEALLGLLRAAIGKSEVREVHRVLLHPLDRQALAPHLERLNLPPRVEILADTTLERGAVLIESSTGMLDASVNTQLDEIERGFVDLMGRRG